MNALKPFTCPDCARSYRTEDAVRDHRRDVHGVAKDAALKVLDPACIECGATAVLVCGDRIYPHRPDLYSKRFWLCGCGAYCGCHGRTSRPLGYPAGAETRAARSRAHAVFDPLWRSGRWSRREAYTKLAAALGIDTEQCHIGMMDREMADRVVQLCTEKVAA